MSASLARARVPVAGEGRFRLALERVSCPCEPRRRCPVIVGFVGCGLLGFTAGLFLCKVKSRWCPECGAWTHRLRPVGHRTPAAR
jgi:hypothetical protein